MVAIKNKKEFMNRVIAEVLQLDVADVISCYIELPKKISGGYQGLCPFHSDKNLGSFVVTPRKGMYHCFSCSAGGNSISFVEKYKGITFVKSAFLIALEYGIISTKENNEFWEKNTTVNNSHNPNAKEGKKKKKYNEEIKLDDYRLDLVFNVILDSLTLTASHIKYLREERGLSIDIINKTKYRSTSLLNDNFIALIKKKLDDIEGLKEDKDEILRGVPGFFQKHINGNWKWLLPSNFGIFIPIRNTKGQIVGLQVRRDKKEVGKSRYSWLSSGFTIGKDGYRYGTSSNTPLGIVYPSSIRSKALFITEGMFKAEIIASKVGAVAISVQGVTNWKGIELFIKETEDEIKKEYDDFKGFDSICIAWDNDMRYKYQVYQALKKMSDIIAKDYEDKEIYYIQWIDEHKGIDDLLLSDKCNEFNSYYNFIKAYEKDNWDTEYKKQVEGLIKNNNFESANQLTEEDLKNHIDIIEK